MFSPAPAFLSPDVATEQRRLSSLFWVLSGSLATGMVLGVGLKRQGDGRAPAGGVLPPDRGTDLRRAFAHALQSEPAGANGSGFVTDL